MATLQITEAIAVPPEHVYVFFVPQRMPYWYGVEMDSRFEMMMGCASDFFVGSRFRISGRVGNKEVSQNARVTGSANTDRLLERDF